MVLVHPLDTRVGARVARQQVLDADADRPLPAREHDAPVGELGHAARVGGLDKLGAGQARRGGVHAKLEHRALPAAVRKGKGVPAVGERAALAEG